MIGSVRASAGYTIVELIVTIVVAGILIVTAGVAISTQSTTSQRGRDMVVANAFIEEKVEALRSKGFLGLTDGTFNITSEVPSELKAPTATMQVTPASTGVKKIVLTISYSDQGQSRTQTYTTLIGELGVGQY